MIRIKLDTSKKNKINELINNFINGKNIINNINDIADYLYSKGCHYTAELLISRAKSDLFIIFGRKELKACVERFEDAIKLDATSLNPRNIIESIYKGVDYKWKKILGFSDLYKKFRKAL